MISSTALDLPRQRAEAEDVCLKEHVFPMEQLPARDTSGVRVSMDMVEQADNYFGIFPWRYGWVSDLDNLGTISGFRQRLENEGSEDSRPAQVGPATIPKLTSLHAQTDYIGSYTFAGRGHSFYEKSRASRKESGPGNE